MAVTGSLIETAPYHNAETGAEGSPGLLAAGTSRGSRFPLPCGGVHFCFSIRGNLGISSLQRSGEPDACPTRAADRCQSRADRFVYLRVAQAYMLISMPTGSSTIFGVFQLIRVSQVVWRDVRAGAEPRSTTDVTQVRWIEDRTMFRHFQHPTLLS
jgi:hypothetical protein